MTKKYPKYETKHTVNIRQKQPDQQWRSLTGKYNYEWGMPGYKSASEELLDKLMTNKSDTAELVNFIKQQNAYGLNNDSIANATSKAGGYAPKRNISPMPKGNFKVLPWYWPYSSYKDYDMAMRGEETALSYEEALAQYKKYKKIAESPATVDFSRTKPKQGEPFVDRFVPYARPVYNVTRRALDSAIDRLTPYYNAAKFGARNALRDGYYNTNEYFSRLSPSVRNALRFGGNVASAAGQVGAGVGAGMLAEEGMNYLWDKMYTPQEQQDMIDYINEKGDTMRQSYFPEQYAKEKAYLAEKAKRNSINNGAMELIAGKNFEDGWVDYGRYKDAISEANKIKAYNDYMQEIGKDALNNPYEYMD